MEKYLIIGLDLSFSSTGIVCGYFENNAIKEISFDKVCFDDGSHKKGFKPTPLTNVCIDTYRIATNITVDMLVIGGKDENDIIELDADNEYGLAGEQIETTLKAMVASKHICAVIDKYILKYPNIPVYFSIENFIMPDFGGKAQMRTVSGLIMLQGYVRANIIRMANIGYKKILPVSPTSLKSQFANNGKADKSDMLNTFVTKYDGLKLLPDATLANLAKVNDIIDAFALVVYTYSKLTFKK